MNYIEIKITGINAQQSEQIIAWLSEINFSGFEENENELKAFIEENNFDEEKVKVILQKNKLKFSKKIIPQQNWNALWEANFKPVVINNFVAVRANFHQPVKTVLHEIIITPKMSFGTGHHATTYMMMQLMREINFKNKTVFDFGTGTGILAILAEKLGALKIIAGDNDDICIENSLENIQYNSCKNIIIQKINSAKQPQIFNIILANINRNIILENIETFKKITQPNSIILLSGLLKDDEQIILNSIKLHDFQHIKTIEQNGWIAMLIHVC